MNRFDEDLKRLVPRKLTIRTASLFGFPTPVEEEWLIGLLLLTRSKNQFESPRVEFRLGELFELMNWQHSGAQPEATRTAGLIGCRPSR